MSELLPIIDMAANRGGSGTGISYYSTAWDCPRRARLDRETEHKADPGYSAGTGIIGHALLDMYYSKDVDPKDVAAIQVSDVAYDSPKQEAVRLVTSYLKEFPGRDFWGDVVASEVQFPAPEVASRVKEFFGVEFTARMDLITRVTDKHLPRIREKTGLFLHPGVYIIDHKFKPGGMDGDKKKSPRKESNPERKYGEFSLQFKAYQLMWNLFHPDEPCMGMIANIIVGTKEVGFQHSMAGAPTAHDLEVLRVYLKSGELLASTDAPNAGACYFDAYNQVCPHYTSGACNRA